MSKKIKHAYETEVLHLSELDDRDASLVEKAKESLKNAYAPYSNFNVGCAVVLDDNTIVTGNNQENAAYPSGLCAERVALFHIGANHSDKGIIKMAIVAKPEGGKSFVQAGPCGACRQVILEYQNKQQTAIEVILLHENDQVVKIRAKDLLPLAFDKDTLLK